MRDNGKNKEYFDLCIIHHSQKSKELKTKINSEKNRSESWIAEQKNNLVCTDINILVAKYSRGDPLVELKKEFEQMIDYSLKNLSYDDSYYYIDMLRFVSLSFLFNLDMQMKNNIRNKLKDNMCYDSLIDLFFTNTNIVPNTETLIKPGIVMELVYAAEKRSCGPLLEYLQKWYHNFQYDPWYAGHGMFDYFGKWSFASAAVAKRFELNDECLKDDPFYPYDLAHFIG